MVSFISRVNKQSFITNNFLELAPFVQPKSHSKPTPKIQITWLNMERLEILSLGETKRLRRKIVLLEWRRKKTIR